MKDQEKAMQSLRARRSFLRTSSLAGLSAAGVAILGGSALTGVATQAQSADSSSGLSANDTAILQFALNLEYLEAEYYTFTVQGKSLADAEVGVTGIGNSGPTTGGYQVNFGSSSDNIKVIANQIGEDERAHVTLLRTVLGADAIAKPEINLSALGAVRNLDEFLALGRAFEDVGVSAYNGAAPLVQSKTILATAARILGTEAEHVGILRLLVAQNGVATSKVDSQDVLPPPYGSYYVSIHNGLTISRTTSEVLAIVFGNSNPGTNSGGFFPKGVNGSITTV